LVLEGNNIGNYKRIGNRNVIHTASLIVPKGESAQVYFSVGSWDIELQITFARQADKVEKGGLLFEGIEGRPN